jgi:hypothetical protein
VVVLTGEQGLRFEFADVGVGRSEFAAEFLQQIFALLGTRLGLGQFNVRFDVADESGQSGLGSKLIFGTLALLQYRLGFFLIAPKIRRGDFFFKGFQKRAVLLRVKDNSERE